MSAPADRTIDRVMSMAHGAQFHNDPIITQSTPNRGGTPLSQTILNAQAQRRTIARYGQVMP